LEQDRFGRSEGKIGKEKERIGRKRRVDNE